RARGRRPRQRAHRPHRKACLPLHAKPRAGGGPGLAAIGPRALRPPPLRGLAAPAEPPVHRAHAASKLLRRSRARAPADLALPRGHARATPGHARGTPGARPGHARGTPGARLRPHSPKTTSASNNPGVDLDPGSGVAEEYVVETALRLRAMLAAEGVDPWPSPSAARACSRWRRWPADPWRRCATASPQRACDPSAVTSADARTGGAICI